MLMKYTVLNPGNSTAVFLIGHEPAGYADKFPGLTFVCIYDFDWNSCLSPWPAERVFRKGEDFSGNADAFLAKVQNVIAETECRERWIAGYSLAGLFSLYACQKTDLFRACASVSGSLWYPGWMDYLKENPVHAGAVYLSVGDKEKDTKNPVMAKVEENTGAAAEIISAYAESVFELNPGGHFGPSDERIMKGLRWLMQVRNPEQTT